MLTYLITVHERNRQTLQDYSGNTALCTKVHCAVETNKHVSYDDDDTMMSFAQKQVQRRKIN